MSLLGKENKTSKIKTCNVWTEMLLGCEQNTLWRCLCWIPFENVIAPVQHIWRFLFVLSLKYICTIKSKNQRKG